MALTKRTYWKLHDYARYILDLIWFQAFLKKIIPLHKHIKHSRRYFLFVFPKKRCDQDKNQTYTNKTKQNNTKPHQRKSNETNTQTNQQTKLNQTKNKEVHVPLRVQNLANVSATIYHLHSSHFCRSFLKINDKMQKRLSKPAHSQTTNS